MTKSREQLRQEYINSLDSFIAQNPKVGQLDTARFRDFLIGLVEHESGFNPIAKQGSYFGWYQTNKLDSDPYQQHLNAFNHLNELFRDTISKADVRKARSRGIKDASLMLKYWNQGNRVNNYIWNNKDSADGLGTKISTYGNDLTMPLDIYNYAMDNLSGNYVVRQGDNWFNIQKRVRTPGRDYATAGKDLWNMQRLTGVPYGSLKVGQTFNFGETDSEYDLETAKRVLPKNLINAWQKNPEKNHLPSGYTDEKGNWRALKSIYHPSWKDELKWQSSPDNINEMLKYGYPENYVSKFLVYKPSGKYQKGGLIYKPFFQETEETNNENDDFLKYSSYNYILDDWSPSYPVEPVKVYNPTISLISSENKSYTPEEKQEESEEPIVENNISSPMEETLETITPGIVSYARRNIDVGKMQEWIDLATKEGVSFTIYSGVRPNAMTKNGHKSNHYIGMALDIGPGKSQTFADLKRQILSSPKLVAFMKEKGIGIINETIPEVMRQTGATGPHFHVGPDKWGLQHFERWLRNEKENLYRL